MVSQAERRQATIAAILAAARKRFAQKGFAETTIDEIAQAGGVAKGAVYHHFSAKEEIFERVVDALMAEIAQAVPIAARAGKDPLDALSRGTQKYLSLIAEPGARRILLADGPAVLGWEKVRNLDIHHFGRMLHVPVAALLHGRRKPREIEALTHLLTGALNEAALVTALAEDPAKAAREMAHAFRALLSGLLAPSTDGSEPSAS
jgi:AcrR family transcriptional regulator